MPAPPVYLDECVDVDLASGLRQLGLAATVARDLGTTGASDEEQITFATRHDWVILSHNTLHFQRWHRTFISQGRSHGGIILVPETGPLSRLTICAAMMLDWIGLLDDHRSQLFKWGQLQFLLTQGYRITGLHYSEADVRHALGATPTP